MCLRKYKKRKKINKPGGNLDERARCRPRVCAQCACLCIYQCTLLGVGEEGRFSITIRFSSTHCKDAPHPTEFELPGANVQNSDGEQKNGKKRKKPPNNPNVYFCFILCAICSPTSCSVVSTTVAETSGWSLFLHCLDGSAAPRVVFTLGAVTMRSLQPSQP